MIILSRNRIDRGDDSGINEPIRKWEVWFQSPFGVLESREDAVKVCEQNGLNPEMTLIPVPVAKADNGVYEVYQR